MRIVQQGHPDLTSVLGTVGHEGMTLLRNTALAGLLLAILDYGLQRRRVGRQLRMTKQEVKDEHRQSEGDPHVKSIIRGKQLAMSRNRMMAEVATATAVIVNPTHVAVAIRYRKTDGRAPRVTAKGKGELAEFMRDLARKNGVPIVENIQLARLQARGGVRPAPLAGRWPALRARWFQVVISIPMGSNAMSG